MKTVIELNVSDQHLTACDMPVIASGGKEECELVFSFSEEWEGFTRAVVFLSKDEAGKELAVKMLLDGDRCILPHEVYRTQGSVLCGVFGVLGDTVRTSTCVNLEIARGAATEGSHPSDVTPDLFAQYVSRIAGNNKDTLEKIQALVDGIVSEDLIGTRISDAVSDYMTENPVPPSKSAYEYAIDGGYTGTEADFAVKMATEVQELPYGGSKEWLEINGDKTKLYQIGGYAWGYVDSEGWTKSDVQFRVVGGTFEMTDNGGIPYLSCPTGATSGAVYKYTEASGDIGVPVYDSKPTTANEGDIIAVGERKYKASLTSKQVPAFTNLAVTLHKNKRYNSSGVLVDQGGACACEEYIPFGSGTVVRIKGLGDLNTYNFMGYDNASTTVKASFKPSAASVSGDYLTYSYDSATGTATLTSKGHSYVQRMRAAGVLKGSVDDVIITVNEKISYNTETTVTWTDIGAYTPPTEAGWSATDEVYNVIDSLDATASNGESAVYRADGFLYSFVGGSDWVQMSRYESPRIIIDGELSDGSVNAVQNKAVCAAINDVKAGIAANSGDILNLERKVDAIAGGSYEVSAEIPSYWSSMIAEKTMAVKALQTEGGKSCVCFAWAADTHIGDSDPGMNKGYSGGRSDCIGVLMAKMLDNCEIPFALISGDVATRSSQPTEAEYLSMLDRVPEALAPLWSTDRLLVALGNHDGTWGDSAGYYRHQFTSERMWQTFFRGQALDFRRVFSEDGLYFYVDNVPQKMRFIVLNSHFGGAYAEDENGYAVNNRFATSCYGSKQLDWLARVALDMPEGYGAIITSHVPPKTLNASGVAYTVDYRLLCGIINAYCNRSAYDGSFTEGVDGWSNGKISVDFTNAKGEIIAMLCGHIHCDTVDTGTLACPLITVISAGAPVNPENLSDGDTPPVRYPWGTDKETSFDVVTVNRAKRRIYCTRVGAGEDREIGY